MEESFELGNYLPISFKTLAEQEYIAFLWDAHDELRLLQYLADSASSTG